MHGDASYCIPAQDALYHIGFVDGNPSGAGTLTEGSGRSRVVYQVEFDGRKSFGTGAQPLRRVESRAKEATEALLPVCGMLAGAKGGPLGYDHCVPISGELIWARPPRCDCLLFNAAECKGKLVVARRGGTDFNRKLLIVQVSLSRSLSLSPLSLPFSLSRTLSLARSRSLPLSLSLSLSLFLSF
jgi:hypothetical protein